MRPGIETTRDLLARLGDPHDAFRSVHIAGTNGKGSTARYLHALLAGSGLRTGLFTSPHLVCLRERIVIGQEAIPERDAAALLARIRPHAEATGATFFEICTALAFLWFAEQRVDVAVIETGLGGRLDSTNIITPAACVFTGVALDHVELLGPTLESIWAEKLGILKRGVPAFALETRPDLARQAEEQARSTGCPFHNLSHPDPAPAPPLAGARQAGNLTLAVEAAAAVLGRRPDPSEVGAHLAGLRWPGRIERLPAAPDWPAIVLDVAHNPDAAAHLAGVLAAERPVVLFAVMADKDWHDVLAPLEAVATRIHLAPLSTPRALLPSTAGTAFPEARTHDSFDAAWSASLAEALAAHRPLLVAGSFHTVGAALRRLWAAGRYRFWPEGIVPDPEIPGQG